MKINESKGVVVFVDDEPYILQTLKAIFRRELNGFQMLFFNHPNEALDYLENEMPNYAGKLVVLTDWLMPGFKGDEFLVQIVQRYPQSHNFLLSGMINKKPDPEILIKGSIVKVIEKPWENNDLIISVLNELK